MFAPGLTSWRAQYDRMARGFERLNRDYKSSVEYEDDLQHFLQDCWHLKDWIRYDPALEIGAKIEAEVSKYSPLLIVADLANASKHHVRDRHRAGADVTSNDVTVHLGQNKPADITYTITLNDGSTLTAKQLIADAMKSWDELLSRLPLSR